jgi:hypothetical protein
MILCAMLLRSIAHSIICTVRLFRGKMHSDWFDGIEILHGRWQYGDKVGYCYPSGLEKTLCKWDMYVPLVKKELSYQYVDDASSINVCGPNRRQEFDVTHSTRLLTFCTLTNIMH